METRCKPTYVQVLKIFLKNVKYPYDTSSDIKYSL